MFQPENRREIVTVAGGAHSVWRFGATPPKESDHPSLPRGLVALAGVSHSLSVSVLPLLVGCTELPSDLDVEEPRLTSPGEVDGTICNRIDGLRCRSCGNARARIRVWIGQADSLIHRVDLDTHVGPISSFSTTTYHLGATSRSRPKPCERQRAVCRACR
jgi:hypothetical protein